MSPFRRRTGWTLVGFSLLLHAFTVFCFIQQPDRFAAFTVLPLWLWGGLGLLISTLAFYYLRAPFSLLLSAIWAITLLVGSDEARALANFGTSPPLPGPAAPHHGKPVIRVVTLNCAIFAFGNPAKDLAAWNPDIVLLQDAFPHQVRQLKEALYQNGGDFRSHQTNGILTRWKIQREVRNPNQRNQQVTITLPDGTAVEVVNVHLATAATDLQFWKRSSWQEHRSNRKLRKTELAIVRQLLKQTTVFPHAPVIFGGDFNAPATDLVHRQMSRDFRDAFTIAGTGWGNTYQRRFPILRIDHLYATPHFTPVRCKTAVTRHSDHRMVIADFVLKDNGAKISVK